MLLLQNRVRRMHCVSLHAAWHTQDQLVYLCLDNASMSCDYMPVVQGDQTQNPIEFCILVKLQQLQHARGSSSITIGNILQSDATNNVTFARVCRNKLPKCRYNHLAAQSCFYERFATVSLARCSCPHSGPWRL